MWLVEETSFACCRPVMKSVGLYADSFASETSSLGVGLVTSRTEMSRPRYERPALYAFTSGNAESWPTIASLSSGLMMWSHVTIGLPGAGAPRRGTGERGRTGDGGNKPVVLITRRAWTSFTLTFTATRST